MNENKKTTLLDDIMYNYDGTFRPFVGHHGNINGEIAYYRDTYMEAEKEYFSQLLADEKVRKYVAELLYSGSYDDIFDEAIQIQERLESGNLESEQEIIQMKSMTPEEREQYHFKKLVYAEGIMCLLFASIRDKALVLDEVKCWEDRFSKMENSVKGLK
jgi:hypothetical protein